MVIPIPVKVPRLSAGPDLLPLLLGSEGQLGVISRATVKVFPVPALRCYGAILFPGKPSVGQFSSHYLYFLSSHQTSIGASPSFVQWHFASVFFPPALF